MPWQKGTADNRGRGTLGPCSCSDDPGLSSPTDQSPESVSTTGQLGPSPESPTPGPTGDTGESCSGNILGKRGVIPDGVMERSQVVVPHPPYRDRWRPSELGRWAEPVPRVRSQPCLAGPPPGRMPCGLLPRPAEGAKASVTSFFHCCPSLITWNEWPFVHERKAACMGL